MTCASSATATCGAFGASAAPLPPRPPHSPAHPPPRSKEFQLHKKANAKFVATFFREWGSYAETLERQAGAAAGELGAQLDPAEVATLSPEQQDQLEKLREEARKLA